MSRVEFKPPSDFVDDSSSSGGSRKVWKILGIGCAVVVLVVGLALAFGAWKTVSCCGDVIDVARLTVGATEFATETANELKAGEAESVHAKMSDALAGRISVEAIRIQRREYARFFENANPRISNVSAQNAGTWDITVEFAPPTAQQKLVILMGIQNLAAEGAENPDFVLDSLQFEQRERDLEAEPAARVVLDFHRALRVGNDEGAYESVKTSFEDMSAFRAFLDDQKPVFRRGEVRVQSVAYRGRFANVVAAIGGEGADRVVVEYELGPSMNAMQPFQITKITPTYNAAGPTGDEQPPANPTRSDTPTGDSNADAADSAGGDASGSGSTTP
jgi:hypothetical protein